MKNVSHSYKQISREALIVIIGSLGSIIVSLLGMRYLTTLISVKTFGEIALLTTIYTAGNTILFGPLNNGIGRYFSIAINTKSFTSFEANCFKLLMYISLIIIIITIFALFFFSNNAFWLYGIAISGVYAISLGYNSYFNTIQLILRERVLYAGLSIFGKVFTFLCPCLFVYFWKSSSILVLCGYTIASLILLATQFFFYTKSKIENEKLLNSVERIQYTTSLLKLSVPYLVFGFFQTLQFSVERWSLNLFCTIEDVGYYTVLNQIGFQTPAIGYGIISSILTPILFEKSGSGNQELITESIKLNNKVILYLMLLSFLFIPIIYFFKENIVYVLVDRKYVLYANLLPLFFAGSIFFNIGQLISNNFIINLLPKKIILPKIVCMIITIGLSLFLSKKNGINGVVIAVCLSSLIYLIWMIVLTKIYLNKL